MNLFSVSSIHVALVASLLIAGHQMWRANASTDVLQIVGGYDQFFKMPNDMSTALENNGTDMPDPLIVRCYNTICRDWLHECHWFCDHEGKSQRCMECLSWRGEHCYPCFKLL